MKLTHTDVDTLDICEREHIYTGYTGVSANL